MKKIILLFFIIVSCSGVKDKKTTNETINIYDNLSFNEFKSKIINYAKNNDYPNLKD